MPIFVGTRYEESEIVGITEEGQPNRTFVYASPKEEQEDKEYETHEQRMGDYVDLIAAIHLNKPADYHKICDINNILDPFEIIEGKKILIPPLG